MVATVDLEVLSSRHASTRAITLIDIPQPIMALRRTTNLPEHLPMLVAFLLVAGHVFGDQPPYPLVLSFPPSAVSSAIRGTLGSYRISPPALRCAAGRCRHRHDKQDDRLHL